MIRTLAIVATAVIAISSPVPAEAKNGNCPPGLAKKDPPCVPPGLANKGVTAEDLGRDDDGIEVTRRGDYDPLRQGDQVKIDGVVYDVLRIGDRIILERADGELFPLPGDSDGYGRVNDALVKVDQTARTVFTIIELGELLVN